MGTVTLIESVEDDFTFDRAWIEDEQGAMVPRAIFGGVMVNIETKPGLLAAGIAFCEPADGTPADSWPIYTIIRGEDGGTETKWNTTGNSRIVQAARAFEKHLQNGTAREGMSL